MDFLKAIPQATGNGSEPLDFTNLPPNILDALIPGYSVISRYIATVFGIDISLFVSVACIVYAVWKGIGMLYRLARSTFYSTFVSSVWIDPYDNIFEMVMEWIAHEQQQMTTRYIEAKTQYGYGDDDDLDVDTGDSVGEDGMFNYMKWNARTPPRYEPYYGIYTFWFKGRPFQFSRSQKEQKNQISYGYGNDNDIIRINCIGRTAAPIRALLRHVKAWSLDRQKNSTTVRHPSSGYWSKTWARPSRPMDTVILENEQKAMIVSDMNEYLHPASPKWYAMRGIPYRRGYLFHGAPGTGKTSLSFALAGIFKVDIFCVSLQDPLMSESGLLGLFTRLPKRCIVLLEDVDSAGLQRDGVDVEEEVKPEKEKKKDKEKSDEKNKRQGISLSGLLNAIDGVASHEGRVLIMTTNHPEKLDPALVRPGRVDMKICFSLCKKEQIRELFVRMYAAGEDDPVMKKLEKLQMINGSLKKLDRSDIEKLAVDFAGRLAEDTFTPAEIQNHLMRYKKDPKAAVDKVQAWAEETIAEKKALEDKKNKAMEDRKKKLEEESKRKKAEEEEKEKAGQSKVSDVKSGEDASRDATKESSEEVDSKPSDDDSDQSGDDADSKDTDSDDSKDSGVTFFLSG